MPFDPAIPALLAACALVSPSRPIARAIAALFAIDVFRQAIAPTIETIPLDPAPLLLRLDVILFVGWAAVLTHLAVVTLTRRPKAAWVAGGALVAYSILIATLCPVPLLIPAQGWSRTLELVIAGWALFAARARQGWLDAEEGIVLLLIAEQAANRIFGAWVEGPDWRIAYPLTVGILVLVLASLGVWRVGWKKDSG